MEIYTIQLARWRLARKRGFMLLDTTSKSGRKEVAPGWELVVKHKNKEISTDMYALRYREIIIESQQLYPDFWKSLLEQETICLACYCTAGFFCHRHLLAEHLRQYALSQGTACVIIGELKED